MTSIEWTHRPGTKGETWNPLRGCSMLSAGCSNCYAMKFANRFSKKPGSPFEGLTKLTDRGPVWTGEVRMIDDMVELPFTWRDPRTVFVNSMSDLFHPDVPFEFIDKIYAVMALCPQHTFIIVTKRASRMLEYYQSREFGVVDNEEIQMFDHRVWGKDSKILPHLREAGWFYDTWKDEDGNSDGDLIFEGVLPLKNVWLLVSVEDQKTADERLPSLIKCPASVRGVSYEPALGPVDLGRWLGYLNWCIAGGESGNNARPPHPNWFRNVRDRCADYGVKFFFKQWGSWHESDLDEGKGIGKNRRHLWPDGKLMYSLGKHKTGNFLDGVQHLEFPA